MRMQVERHLRIGCIQSREKRILHTDLNRRARSFARSKRAYHRLGRWQGDVIFVATRTVLTRHYLKAETLPAVGPDFFEQTAANFFHSKKKTMSRTWVKPSTNVQCLVVCSLSITIYKNYLQTMPQSVPLSQWWRSPWGSGNDKFLGRGQAFTGGEYCFWWPQGLQCTISTCQYWFQGLRCAHQGTVLYGRRSR